MAVAINLYNIILFKLSFQFINHIKFIIKKSIQFEICKKLIFLCIYKNKILYTKTITISFFISLNIDYKYKIVIFTKNIK